MGVRLEPALSLARHGHSRHDRELPQETMVHRTNLGPGRSSSWKLRFSAPSRQAPRWRRNRAAVEPSPGCHQFPLLSDPFRVEWRSGKPTRRIDRAG